MTSVIESIGHSTVDGAFVLLLLLPHVAIGGAVEAIPEEIVVTLGSVQCIHQCYHRAAFANIDIFKLEYFELGELH